MAEVFHIQRVLIENFRCIDSLDLEFHTSPGEGCVAVLAGDNGCGKTSVLEAIRAGVGGLGGAFWGKDTKQGATSSNVWIEFVSQSGQKKLSNRYAGKHHFDSMEDFQAISRGIDQGLIAFNLRHERLHFQRSTEKRLLNVYSRSIRNGGLKESSPFVRLQNALRPFLGLEWTLDVLFEDERQDADPRLVFRNDALPDEVNSISQAHKLSISQRLPLVITLEQLSSGQLALFSLMGPLVFASPEQPPLVLIDEPEQHMHPSWQRALLPALRQLSPLSQFIVATHSVDVLHSVASYERHLLLREDDPRTSAWREHRPEAREP